MNKNKLEKTTLFANRSGLDLKFFKYDKSRGAYGFKADEDPLLVNFVNSCSLETNGDTAWATGGMGFKRLIGFDNPLEGTFTIETQLTNPAVWAMLAGLDPKDFNKKKINFSNDPKRRKFYFVLECVTLYKDEEGVNHTQNITLHKASVQRAFSVSYTGDGDPQSITITLDLADNENSDLVTLGFEDEEEGDYPVVDVPAPSGVFRLMSREVGGVSQNIDGVDATMTISGSAVTFLLNGNAETVAITDGKITMTDEVLTLLGYTGHIVDNVATAYADGEIIITMSVDGNAHVYVFNAITA